MVLAEAVAEMAAVALLLAAPAASMEAALEIRLAPPARSTARKACWFSPTIHKLSESRIVTP